VASLGSQFATLFILPFGVSKKYTCLTLMPRSLLLLTPPILPQYSPNTHSLNTLPILTPPILSQYSLSTLPILSQYSLGLCSTWRILHFHCVQNHPGYLCSFRLFLCPLLFVAAWQLTTQLNFSDMPGLKVQWFQATSTVVLPLCDPS